MNESIYINTSEASKLLGVSLRTVQEWCKLQKIPSCMKLGKIYLINKNELFKWLKQQEQRPNKIWLVPKYERIK
jgi:excisionase family DNA binding protein